MGGLAFGSGLISALTPLAFTNGSVNSSVLVPLLRTPIWSARAVYLRGAILKERPPRNPSRDTILPILSRTLFEKTYGTHQVGKL